MQLKLIFHTEVVVQPVLLVGLENSIQNRRPGSFQDMTKSSKTI